MVGTDGVAGAVGAVGRDGVIKRDGLIEGVGGLIEQDVVKKSMM